MNAFQGELGRTAGWLPRLLVVVIALNVAAALLLGPDREHARLAVEAVNGDPVAAAALQSELASAPSQAWDPVGVGAVYMKAARADPLWDALMASKYRRAAALVAVRPAASDPLWASATTLEHRFVYGTLGRMALGESLLLVALVTASLMAEPRPSPAPVLASTRVGRRLAVVRLASALAWTVPVVALAYASGPGVRLVMIGGWSQRVDGPFHRWFDLVAGERPFFTWLPWTVTGYLAASVAVAVGLACVVALGVWCCTRLIDNAYLAGAAWTASGLAGLVVPMLQLPGISWIASLNPVWAVVQHPAWFSDAGLGSPLVAFETVTVAVGLAGGVCLAFAAGAWHGTRDITA